MLIFLRYFPIIYCSLYILSKIKIQKDTNINIKHAISSILITIIISLPFFAFRLLFVIALTCLYLTLTNTSSLIHNLFMVIVAYGLSFGFYSIAVVVVSYIFANLFPNNIIIQDYSLMFLLIIGSFHYIIVYIAFLIPQFKNGIISILKTNRLFHGLIISLAIIIFIIYISNTHTSVHSTHSHIIIIYILLSILPLYYWRHRIKQTYIENMRRLETLTYENTIADKDKQIKTLEDNNAYLGRIIHKYRKTIPAMELSVMELLQNCETLSPEELKTKAESLQTQLVELQKDRDNLLDKYQKEASITTHTGLHTVDAMLALMKKRAKQEWIRYKVQITQDIHKLASTSIKEAALLHLLGDLTENAIHAVNSTDKKDILIHFGKMNDCFLLEISDSGCAFDIQTYQNFGMEPSSSHTEDGGTGTGLMDIWKIKKEYKASLYIYEYEREDSGNPYTKKISFLFDGKNHFLLKTYREQEVKNALLRGDIHVFPHQTD